MRTLLGVLARDVPLYARLLLAGGDRFQRIRNRNERLSPAPDGNGWQCEWPWTSDLHAPKHLPALGRALMRRALHAYPIVLAEAPRTIGMPQVTFIIGHRGTARLPQLLATLRSIAGQRDASVECIVVEQDGPGPSLAGQLPSWVRHVHTPPPSAALPYCRSWAFNAGAKHARAPVLVLHDNDMLVPAAYASEIVRRVAQGYEALNLKRFIFYLGEAASHDISRGSIQPGDAAIETIVQNAAGGSIAITVDAFDRIGGMDESFVGWGGEDNEFWERARTLRVWDWGFLPMLHLWHAAQPRKAQQDSATRMRYELLSRIPAAERIDRLRKQPRGSLAGPEGWAG